MDDYISRQAAIEAITMAFKSMRVYASAETFLSKVPPADVRPVVRGRWVLLDHQEEWHTKDRNYIYECSRCGHTDIQAQNKEVPFCWFCGADMREETDGQTDNP